MAISSRLTRRLSFVDEKDLYLFELFLMNDAPLGTLSTIAMIMSVFALFTFSKSRQLLIFALLLVCIWAYCFLIWIHQRNIQIDGHQWLRRGITTTGNLIIILSPILPLFLNKTSEDDNSLKVIFMSMLGMLMVEVFFVCHSFKVTVFTAGVLIIQTVVFVVWNGDMSLLSLLGLFVPFVLALYFINAGMKKRFLLESELGAVRESLSEIKQENDRVHAHTMEMHHMIGSVTHDLKTPLQAFAFELDHLKEICQQLSNPNRALSCKQSILDSTSQLKGTISFMTVAINRSLDYTKVSTGVELTPSISSVNVNETIEWVINSLSRKTRNSVSIRVGDFVGDISKFILTDKQWLIENVFCFLSNAQKFTSEGEIVVRCVLPAAQSTPAASIASASTASASSSAVHGQQQSQTQTQAQCESGAGGREEEKHAMLTVEVMDSGIGLSDDQKEGLFRPFKQAQRGAGGTGLGLYSLLKRVECLGGECGVRDRPDKRSGSVFWFSIPYIPDKHLATVHSAIDVLDPSESVSVTESVPGGRSKRILVVDDSLLIQKATRRSLEREGFSVDVADNGYECLKLLNSIEESGDGGYDLILLDIHMPIMDGLETVKRIRSQESKARFRCVDGDNGVSGGGDNSVLRGNCYCGGLVVGFSGNSDEGTKTEAIDAGMDAFISKPLSMAEFFEVCSRFKIL